MATPISKPTDHSSKRWMMRLAFRGEPFHGWQRQPGALSVQQVVEEALATVLRVPQPVPVTGAGRTDAGVNASMMPAHFDAALAIPPQALVRALNSILGRDIAVEEIVPVHADAHARFDATSRTYHYYAIGEKSPFVYPLTWRAPSALDYDAMNEAASLLLSTDDFTSFSKLHTDAKTNICRVSRAEWVPTSGGRGMTFVITADRFLRNMVRAIVGTLVEVGRGKLSADGFASIIAARDRCAAGTSMPPQALFLSRVTYPYLDW